MRIQKPSIGRIVEVSIVPTYHGGVVTRRPGVIVAVDFPNRPADEVNLHVFYDGTNDAAISRAMHVNELGWRPFVRFNADGIVPEGQFATWRYPAREEGTIEVTGG